MRAENQETCSQTAQGNNIKGIIRYAGAPENVPTSLRHPYKTDECVDEPYNKLIPIKAMDASTSDLSFEYDVTVKDNGKNLFRWWLNKTTFNSDLGSPTLLSYLTNSSIPPISGDLLLDVPNLGEWVYIILESDIRLPHPVHLHGHDFFVLAQGQGPYAHGVSKVKFDNPPRRDTAMLPSKGHLVVAWKADNPGAWLLHCHVGWHQAMGFALQVLEAKDKIVDTISDPGMMGYTCKRWNEWVDSSKYKQWDSGI
jgi:hypothetical protein